MNRAFILPALRDLGPDLLHLSRGRRIWTLAIPFVWCGAYFAFAIVGWWPLAVFALVALSFMTYGSASHDLVHRNLGLPKIANDVLLCLMELLALRSGHAYQAVHLHHHARYPHADDIESAAARRSWWGALLEGVTFQPRIWLWALRHGHANRWVLGEGAACLGLFTLAVGLAPLTLIPLTYAVLMVMGSLDHSRDDVLPTARPVGGE